MPALWIILGLVVLFLLVIVVRALLFRPPVGKTSGSAAARIDGAAATEHLARMVRIPTVSSRDPARMDLAQFRAFEELLMELYPNVHRTCPREKLGRTALLYHWKGKQAGDPTVLMAHYDVVPACGDGWEQPPFCGEVIDGVLWGRGTLDTKSTLCGILEAAEALIASGFQPERDIYLSFSGDEETMGPSAPAVVDALEKRGIRPALVLDEGGAIVEHMFPGVKRPCAVVGIGEKGIMDMEFTVKSKGGHASAPPPGSPIPVLAEAVRSMEKKPFKAVLTPAAAEMFDTLGRHSSFAYKLLFANLWCFLPLLKLICTKTGGELNALMRTTCAFTMMEGSPAVNVLPQQAKITANLRLVRGDTVESATEYLRKTIDNPRVELHVAMGMNPSPYADTGSPAWAVVKEAIEATWPEAVVSPYMMVACSDSRHFCRICDNVLRFSAMPLSKEERASIHGINEKIPVDKIKTAAEFFSRVIQKC